MSLRTLTTLAELQYRFGLISIDEYVERCRVAEWLYDGSGQHVDPRNSFAKECERENEDRCSSGDAAVTVQQGDPNDPTDPGYLSFLFSGWVFTKADPDPYPSTPHGHWQSQNNKWPKLNPYNGRVFRANRNEDTPKRLNKSQMKVLWNDEKFKDFCRGHLVWYCEKHPYHVFGMEPDRLFRFPRW